MEVRKEGLKEVREKLVKCLHRQSPWLLAHLNILSRQKHMMDFATLFLMRTEDAMDLLEPVYGKIRRLIVNIIVRCIGMVLGVDKHEMMVNMVMESPREFPALIKNIIAGKTGS
ncbi:MAG: hypothetical protein F7C32_02215 [Desulfurococcales archaeon]|nr:hypothetical protein [Desulfurococcales archaeon]